MARKVEELTITGEGRDHGKIFVITEMPARKAEKWAKRAMMQLSRGAAAVASQDIEKDHAGWGVVVVALGALGGLDWKEVEPLMDEMLECVQIKTGSSIVRALVADDDIEEIVTLLRLRQRILELHSGLRLTEVFQQARSAIASRAAA